VGVGGLGVWPHPPIPNPQSPIPNPPIEIIYLYLYYINKIYLIIEIYENYFIIKKITIQ
jgi:hypothetical protein